MADNSSSVTIKPEPEDDTAQTSWPFHNNEVINLLSDDEGDEINMAGRPAPTLGSPFEMASRTADDDEVMADITVDTDVQPTNDGQPTVEKPSHTDVLALQKKMLARFSNQQRVEETPSVASPPTPPAPKPRAGRAKQNKKNDAAAARFQKIKEAWLKKKRANTLSIEDEIIFMKSESAESARLRKLEADEDFDRTPSADEDEEGLFVGDEPAVPSYSAMYSDQEQQPRKRKGPFVEDDSDELPEGPRKRTKTGRNAGKAAKKAKKVLGADYTGDEFENVLQQARRQVKPKKAAPTRGKKTGASMTNTASVFGGNIFGDTQKTANLANQPGFDKGPRKKALQDLIASVPEESRKVANMDRKFLDNAIKSFTGYASVKPEDDGNWSLKGMKTHLKHYQVLGIAFMRQRENDTHEPKGGILADEMGLGKTIMMLGNIVNGKPTEKAKGRATLVVASPALVQQWDAEIRTHCESRRQGSKHGIGTVIQHRSGSRIASNDNLGLLETADIVLTTYHEVARSYPKAVIPSNLVTAAQKDVWWREHFEKERGVLHRIRFHRVVLDEAQAIKNHKGHTSMACRALDSKHNWAITGTPVMNTLKEFYPYFKFLKEPNTGSFKIFKENFCTPGDPDGVQRLNVFLRKFMIRRTHIDTLFNARLLDLPTPHEHTLWLEFNEVERQIYEIVKKRFIQRINTIARQGGLQKQYNHIWTMILRLRQICGHILLIQGTIVDLLEREDFEKLNRITESEDEMSDGGAALLVHLRTVLQNNTGVKTIETGFGSAVLTENESLPTGVLDVGDTQGATGGKHGLSFRFRKFLDNLLKSSQWDAIQQRSLCCGCRQPPNNPHVTSCFHIYCFACLKDLQHYSARRGHDQARCGECGEAYTTTQPCEGFDTFQARETSSTSADLQTAKKPAKGKKKDDEMGDWINMKGEVLPSAKTLATKACILNWIEEDPDAKIIIYTQFLPMVRILGRMCQTEKLGFCTYTGAMSHDSRAKAIEEFAEKPEKQILLASLKCGGLGLNLTMASRVICIDPWWNQAVEQQAFCRVFRIGQTKETRMTRLVVKNTIDAALVAIKERKQMEIDEVMDDSKRREKLSVHDLLRLFGPVGEDEEGKPFIFADGNDEGGPEHLRLANIDEDDEEQRMGNSP